MKEKSGKIIIIVMGLIIVALLCFSGYLLYDKINTDNKLIGNSNNDSGNYLTLIEGYEVKVESGDAKFITKNGNYVLYNDNGLVLYNLEDKIKEKINIEYNNHLVFEILNDIRITGDMYIAYYDSRCFDSEPKLENNSGIYNVETKEVSLKNKYSFYEGVASKDSDYFNYVVAYEYDKTKKEFVAKIIELKSMKVVITYDYGFGSCDYIATYSYDYWNADVGDGTLITIYTGNTCGDNGARDNYIIYDNKGKVVDKIKSNEGVEFISVEGDLKLYKYTRNSSSKIFDSEE